MAGHDDEEHLYLWVRIIGSLVLIFTVVVIGLAVVIIPAFNHDYRVDGTAVVGIVGMLLASGLALIEVTVRLKRNGWGISSKRDEGDDDGDP